MTQTIELLLIQAGGQAYALPLGVVQEIRGWTNVTVLPTDDPSCLGIINLRGVVLHVLDVRRMLGVPAELPTPSNVVVVVNTGTRQLGLLVDGVSDIISIEAEKVSDSDAGGAWGTHLIDGIVNYADNLYPRLNIDEIAPRSAETASGRAAGLAA